LKIFCRCNDVQILLGATRSTLLALAESAAIRAVMARLVAGTEPYGTLKWSLARTAELGLAWRLVRSKWYNQRSVFKEQRNG